MSGGVHLRVLSLGAGVQSTTLALMSARGELDRLDYAIFSDTGWEPAAVYAHLDWLEALLPFPVIRARRDGVDLGELSLSTAAGVRPHAGAPLPPWHVAEPHGMLSKHCSKEFKTRVVGRVIRELLGIEPGKRGPKEVCVETWLGISQEEMQRMKDSEQRFVRNRWPLVELRMRRHDCLRWMEERQYPRPPKSSCIFCPYRTTRQWREMRDGAPDDWRRAVAFDRGIRAGYHGMQGQAFVCRQRVPLEQADLSTMVDMGQFEFGFLEECEGHCGT